MSDQNWAVQAKEQGYPLCEACLEPLVKERWGFQYCGSCELGLRRVIERRHSDEQFARWYRKHGVE